MIWILYCGGIWPLLYGKEEIFFWWDILPRTYALSLISKCFRSHLGISTTALRWSKVFKAQPVSNWQGHYYLVVSHLLIELQESLSPLWAFTTFTDSDMFNLLCELCMTRNILLAAQGTACAVNCGACLLHTVLISATDTPRNLCRLKKKKKKEKY